MLIIEAIAAMRSSAGANEIDECYSASYFSFYNEPISVLINSANSANSASIPSS